MRFDYDRMSARQFSEALRSLAMKPATFARLFGVNDRVVRKWIASEQDIPPWVSQAVELMRLPGAFTVARDVAALMIRADKENPERGEYPYQAGRQWPDDDTPLDAPSSATADSGRDGL